MKQDPFRQARERDGILVCPFQGGDVPMLLDYRDLRQRLVADGRHTRGPRSHEYTLVPDARRH